jgi:thiosulfate reductase cytochrome b subunit
MSPSSSPEQAPGDGIRDTAGGGIRRGLPRTPGGAPWPAAERPTSPAVSASPVPASASPTTASTSQTTASTAIERDAVSPPSPATRSGPRPDSAPAAGTVAAAAGPDLSIPLPFTRTVWPGVAARARTGHDHGRAAPRRIRGLTRAQLALATVLGGGALLFAAAMAVAAARWLISLDVTREFLAVFPGEYALPAGSAEGFPAWVQWQHFFNVFLMVLVIRTGLQVRSEKRPAVFWSPRGNRKRRISLTLWLHQALDVLWLVNGVIFVVLLFVTGHWVRLVPTSWEVFPNALSAALQYVSLQWPTENGWVNYNSLQQLAYFTTVFVAAPLATITGLRMSGVWPKDAHSLSRLYPVEWARAIHFPVMLYFVAFIVVHVALVFATGALRNLNHMYGGTDAVNWVGFWIFVVSLAAIVAGWVAARPLVVAPIAKLFGTVKGR